jgi:hypothetical protein
MLQHALKDTGNSERNTGRDQKRPCQLGSARSLRLPLHHVKNCP